MPKNPRHRSKYYIGEATIGWGIALAVMVLFATLLLRFGA
jgi:hypothetical protein